MGQTYEAANVVWQGRVHLGDEPGFYGDATFVGLCLELPLELIPYSGVDESEGEVRLILEADGIQQARGYPGHKVAVAGYSEDKANHTWREGHILAEGRLSEDTHGTLEVHS